jgi:hypothetical protein
MDFQFVVLPTRFSRHSKVARSANDRRHFEEMTAVQDTFDYVVIGGGSAGCVLPRGSANPSNTVFCW